MLKDLPRYERLLEAAKEYPDLEPSACEAFMHLLRAGDDVFRVMSAFFCEHSISQGRFVVLLLLIDKGTGCPCVMSTPAQLADKAGVTRATMTGLIDTLERDGYVRREPDPKDRRMMFVKLTPQGESFIKSLLPLHFRRMSYLMGTLTIEERKMLVRLLEKIVERTSAIATPAEGGLTECPAVPLAPS